MKKQSSQEVDQRWAEFWRDHKDFDSSWARNVLHQLSEFLPFVFKFDAVKDGLPQLYIKSGVDGPEDWDWSRDWTAADEALPALALRELPIFRLALALDAYAYYGLKLEIEKESFHGLDQFLEDWENRATPSHPGWLTLFPHEWGGNEIEQTVTAAFARRKLDQKQNNGLKPEELAALVKLPRKNIVNLLGPASRILKTNSKGLISIESARRWLSTRRDFRPSIWQQQQSEALLPTLDSEPFINEAPTFVPVATDGSWFSPADRNKKDGNFHVASGSHEEKYEDYWQALAFLSKSKSPSWRYRDAAGRRWRAKTGRGDWLRKSRDEIETLLNKSQ